MKSLQREAKLPPSGARCNSYALATLNSVDQFLDRVYDDASYNCLHFTDEVWLAATGRSIRERLAGLMSGPLASRRIRKGADSDFQRLQEPSSPCLVLLLNPKARPHTGVYIRGRLLHLTRAGVEYQPLKLASLFFKRQRFYYG